MKTLDLLTLGEIMLRLSAPSDERLVRGNTFLRQAGGAGSGVSKTAVQRSLLTSITVPAFGAEPKHKRRSNSFCHTWTISSVPKALHT